MRIPGLFQIGLGSHRGRTGEGLFRLVKAARPAFSRDDSFIYRVFFSAAGAERSRAEEDLVL